MRIGQVSKQVGVSIDAIRFYERNRLLAAPTRSEGGFRLYSSDDLATLQFIRSVLRCAEDARPQAKGHSRKENRLGGVGG